MAENNFGTNFSIDITDLKAGLAQANRLIKESASEFSAAAAEMGDWTKSQEGLEKRIKYLNSAIDLQQKKVDALTKDYEEQIANGLDPASKAAVELRTKINNETTALNKNKKELKKQDEALNELKNGSEEAAEAVEEVGEAAEDAGDGFTVAKGALADFISDGIQNLIGSVKDAIGSLISLADETKEYRNEMAKLETAFSQAGFGVEETEKAFKELYGILGDEGAAVEAAQQLAQISKTEEDLNKNTRILTGVMATYGTSIPTEGLAEAMAATSNMGSVQGVLADALEWQGVNLDKFNEKLGKMKTEEERTAYIQETLTGLYGEAADAYTEINKEVIDANKAQADYNATQAEMGEKMQPISNSIKEGMNEVMRAFLDIVEGVDFQAIADGISDAFEWLTAEGIPALINGFEWIKKNLPTVATIVGGLTTAFVLQKAATLWASLTTESMNKAMMALNATMKANMIGIVITAITALVAAFIYLWNNCDEFREFWINLWNRIKEVTAATWKAIKAFFKGAWEAVRLLWGGAGRFFSGTWENIKKAFSSCVSFFGSVFSKAWTAVKNAFSAVGDFFGGIWNTIKEKFTSVGTMVAEAIGGAFKAAINNVIRMVEANLNLIPNTVNAALGAINKLPGVQIDPLPTFSLPRLAKGGVVNGATAALIGEAGREAVIPLERNTGWMDTLAEKLTEKMGGGVVVNQTNNYSAAHSRYEIFKSKEETARAVRLALRGV